MLAVLKQVSAAQVKNFLIDNAKEALHFYAYGRLPEKKVAVVKENTIKITRDNVLLLDKVLLRMTQLQDQAMDREVSETRRKSITLQATSFANTLSAFRAEVTKPSSDLEGIDHYVDYPGELGAASSLMLSRVERATGRRLQSVWF